MAMADPFDGQEHPATQKSIQRVTSDPEFMAFLTEQIAEVDARVQAANE